MFSTVVFHVFIGAAESKSLTWFFEQCDTIGKIVTVLLIFCSAVSIATMVQKVLELSDLRRRNLSFEMKLRGVDSIIGINILRGMGELSPYEYLSAEAGAAFQRHRGKTITNESITLCMGHVENAIQRGIARQLVRYERKLILLTTFVSGGPFIGLFGTVYGVMIAFGGLSEKASIAQLAPGVAGALITTICGLGVAIPATFGYNYLITQTKIMTTELENFASSLADRIELELQGIRHAAEEREREDTREQNRTRQAPRTQPDAPQTRMLRPPVTTSSDFDIAPGGNENPDTSPKLRESRGWDDVPHA